MVVIRSKKSRGVRLSASFPLKLLIALVFFTIAVGLYVSVKLHSLEVSPLEDHFISLNSTRSVAAETLQENGDKTRTNPALSDPERQPILKILRSAGYDFDDNKTFTPEVWESLPKWSEIVELYGKEPTILGMETCSWYRELVPEQRHREGGVAGLFNSGTNVLHTGMIV